MVMRGISRITTEKAEVRLLNNGILKIIVLPNSKIDLKSAKMITDTSEDISGANIHANLFDIRKMIFISNDARKHFFNFSNPNTIAVAILIDSKIHKALMKMYFKFSSPKTNTRVFDDERKAKFWLSLKIKDATKKKISSDVLF